MLRLPACNRSLAVRAPAVLDWSKIAARAHEVHASSGVIRLRATRTLSSLGSLLVMCGFAFGSMAWAQTAQFSGAQGTVGSGMGSPYGVAADSSGNVYINDFNNQRVLKETLSQGGYTQSVVLQLASSGIVAPFGIAADASGNLYLTAEFNGASGTGEVFKETLSSGSYTQSVVASGLYQPDGVAVGANGNVYIADSHNGRVLMETPSGTGYTQSVIASGLGDPSGVAVDGSGNVYVVDSQKNELLKETPSAGSYTQSVLLSSSLNVPSAVAVDGNGNLYITNLSEDGVLKETLSAGAYTLSTLPAAGLNRPSGVAVDALGNIFIADSGNNRAVEMAQFVGNFGPVNVASRSSAPIPAIFTFDTAGTLGTISVVTEGKTRLDFYNAGGGSCVAGSTYSAGETCTVNVNFKPTLPGTRYGAALLHNESGGVIATGYVQGTGVGPQVAYGSTWQVISPTTPGIPVSFFGEAEDGAGNIFSASGNELVETPASGGAPIVTEPTADGEAIGLAGPVAVDGAGDVFISDGQNARVVKVPAGGGAATAITGAGSSDEMAVDGAGDLFMTDPYFYTVPGLECCLFEVPAGSSTPTQINSSYAAFIMGVAVDSVGDLFISNYGYNGPGNLLELTTGGQQIAFTLPSPYGYWPAPNDVAEDDLGDLYVYDSDNGYILELQRSQPPALSTYTDNPQSVQILNIGNASLTFPIPRAGDNPSTSGNLTLNTGEATACPVITASSSDPGTLAAGTSCLLSMSLTPGTTETGGALTLTDTNLNAGPPKYARQIFQVSSAVQAPVPPSSGDFGTVEVGRKSLAPASLSIATAGTLASISVVTLGSAGLDFSNAGRGTCTIGTAYSAGNSCIVRVGFKPRYAGARYGAVLLYNSSGSVIATRFVQGIGVGPQVAFGPGTPTVISPVANGNGLSLPYGTAVDGAGDLFIADLNNNRVVEVPAAGSAAIVISPTVNGTALSGPSGVAVDGAGDLFIADSGNNRVVEMPAGDGAAMAISATATEFGEQFSGLNGIAVDGAGSLFMAECGGIVSGLVDVPAGGGAQTAIVAPDKGIASLCPYGAAVDAAGDLFIADQSNNVVVELPAGGGVATTISPTVNGEGLNAPYSVAVDAAGDLFIADTGNNRVVELPADGGAATAIDPTVNGEGLNMPRGVALDAAGNLFITDSLNNRILKIPRSQPPALSFAATVVGSTSTDSPQTVQLLNIGNAPFTFRIPIVGDDPSISPNFTLNRSEASACPVVTSRSSRPGTLGAGSDCLLSISFTPESPGPDNGVLALTDTNLDFAFRHHTALTIQLSGTGVASPTVLTSPVPGAVLGTRNIVFNWTPGTGDTKYLLDLGTHPGISNLYVSDLMTTTSVTVPRLFPRGETVYATLWSKIGDTWQSTKATYTASQ
jgi:sugar lactone lactonase YvrE